MKIVWTHIGGRRVVPLQFHWNVYIAWPLFNRMSPCGLCERGSWGGHRQAELELPQSPKWFKKKKKRLYSEGTVLKYISLLERTIIPSHFHPLWESKISSYSTLPLYLDSTHKCPSQANFPVYSESNFLQLQLVEKPLRPPILYPSLEVITLIDNPEPIPDCICWLGAWSLYSCEVTPHLP